MPVAPRRPCLHRGCPALVSRGYCLEHAKLHERTSYAEDKAKRGTSADRGYTSRWRRLRAWLLNREPLCRQCAVSGLIVPAALVDHIVPLLHGGTHAVTNLQPLCVACHAVKTQEDMRRIRAGQRKDSS